MGGQMLARGARSPIVTCPPPRSSPVARDHHLFAAAACVLRLEASSSSSTTYLWNKLLGLFSRGGAHAHAHRLFDGMPERAHIACLSRSGSTAEGARAYSRMLLEDGGSVRPDETTLSALLALPCPRSASCGFVRQVHSHAVRLGLCSNAFVGTALVRAYEQCGNADAITAVFEEVAEPDAVCWNVMIDACTRNGSLRCAVEMLSRMRRAGGIADCFTLASILKACCSREEDLSLGLQLHTWACKIGVNSETAICNALITMYLKCGGETSSAVQVFKRISEPNIITWTAMISGLGQNGLLVGAVSFYKEMVRTGLRENDYCFTSVLSAFGARKS